MDERLTKLEASIVDFAAMKAEMDTLVNAKTNAKNIGIYVTY